MKEIQDASIDLLNKFNDFYKINKSEAISLLERHIVECASVSSSFLSGIETDRNLVQDLLGLDNERFKKLMINLIESNNLSKS